MNEKRNKTGQMIRSARERAGLGSIDDAAPKLGVSRGTLGRYERGKGSPDVAFLARLCALTGEQFQQFITAQIEDAGFESESLFVEDESASYSVPETLGPMGTRLAMSIMPTEWAVLLTELTMRGMLTTDGAIRIAEFFDDWQPSEQWLQYMEEAK